MTIEDIMIKHKLMSDVVTLEFGKPHDNAITILLNGDELFSITTKLDCYKFDLDYFVDGEELDDVKKVLQLVKRMVNLVLRHKEE